MMDINEIREYLPHRYPFLLVDRVVELDTEAKRVRAFKNVTINEPFFNGHFPQHPIMPGVLIIEAMAQTAAVLVVATLGSKSEGKLVYFMAIDSARFRKPVGPGDTLRVHVTKQAERGNVWKFVGKAKTGNDVVADATFSAMIMDR